MGKWQLTSLEGVLEWVGVIYLEALLSSTGEASLILVESDIEDFIFICYHRAKD